MKRIKLALAALIAIGSLAGLAGCGEKACEHEYKIEGPVKSCTICGEKAYMTLEEARDYINTTFAESSSGSDSNITATCTGEVLNIKYVHPTSSDTLKSDIEVMDNFYQRFGAPTGEFAQAAWEKKDYSRSNYDTHIVREPLIDLLKDMCGENLKNYTYEVYTNDDMMLFKYENDELTYDWFVDTFGKYGYVPNQNWISDTTDGKIGDNDYDGDIDEDDWETEWNDYVNNAMDEFDGGY